MPESRLPIGPVLSWVREPRTPGGQEMIYGRSHRVSHPRAGTRGVTSPFNQGPLLYRQTINVVEPGPLPEDTRWYLAQCAAEVSERRAAFVAAKETPVTT